MQHTRRVTAITAQALTRGQRTHSLLVTSLGFSRQLRDFEGHLPVWIQYDYLFILAWKVLPLYTSYHYGGLTTFSDCSLQCVCVCARVYACALSCVCLLRPHGL